MVLGQLDEHVTVLAARRLPSVCFGRLAADPVDVTRVLLAVQAQDPRAARLAIRARTRGGHDSEIGR